MDGCESCMKSIFSTAYSYPSFCLPLYVATEEGGKEGGALLIVTAPSLIAPLSFFIMAQPPIEERASGRRTVVGGKNESNKAKAARRRVAFQLTSQPLHFRTDRRREHHLANLHLPPSSCFRYLLPSSAWISFPSGFGFQQLRGTRSARVYP